MKIIYLHDSTAEPSILPILEEAFPMIEILTPTLHQDTEKCLESLKELFRKFSYSNPYVLVSDGVGIVFSSYFNHYIEHEFCTPKISVLINPDYRTIKLSPTYRHIPQNSLGRGCLDHHCCKAIFTSDKLHLLHYHKKNHGGDFLLKPIDELKSTLFDLIHIGLLGWVSIDYLKIPVMTPNGQILPPDHPLISVNSEFDWFGEKLFINRIPRNALRFRSSARYIPSFRYLLPGDIITNAYDKCLATCEAEVVRIEKYFKYNTNGNFINIITGERVKGISAPFAGYSFHGILPDWETKWCLKDYVNYKICIPFESIKNAKVGYDKYGNRINIISRDEDLYPDATLILDQGCARTDYLVGTYPNSEHPEQKYIMPYSYEGIMVFRNSPKTIFNCPMSKILERRRRFAESTEHIESTKQN